MITGITGFMGTNLVAYLKQQKEPYEIIGVSRNPDAALKFPDSINGMLENISTNLIDEKKIDTIIHLAGIAHDLKGLYKDDDYDAINYKWTKDIYEQFLASTANKFIYMSSVKAITDQVIGILTEDATADPKTPYGISKRRSEEYLLDPDLRGNKNVYILRPVMVHGPGNKGNLNLLYKFVKKGIPFPLGAFHNQRSFLSIDNLCFIINKMLNQDVKSGAYILSDDGALSTNQLIELIGESSSKKARIWNVPKYIIYLIAKIGEYLPLPLNHQVLDKLAGSYVVSNEKIKDELGVTLPTSMRDGLLNTIKSFQNEF